MTSCATPAVWNGQGVEITNPAHYQAGLRALQLGVGEALVLRVERLEGALSYGQLKYWHGYVVGPLVEWTGDHDWRLYLKAMFLPEGKHSLTELSYAEMRAFTEHSEAWARQWCPEAYWEERDARLQLHR